MEFSLVFQWVRANKRRSLEKFTWKENFMALMNTSEDKSFYLPNNTIGFIYRQLKS